MPPRQQEMPELVHEHEDAEHEDERQDVGHVVVLASGRGSAGARRLQSGLSIRAGPGIEFPDGGQRPGPAAHPGARPPRGRRRCSRRWPGTAPRPRGKTPPRPRWPRSAPPGRRRRPRGPGRPGAGRGTGRGPGASNSSRRQSSRLRVGSAPSQRSGHEKAYWMGSRMSVTPSWAIIDPSVSSTSEWTTDCGWTTTSIAAGGVPNSQCASITSRPLFISVAESMVILRPIRQVGWLSAASTVTPASASADRCRNGPPDAVRISRRTSDGIAPVQALVDGVVLAVDRQHVDAVRPAPGPSPGGRPSPALPCWRARCACRPGSPRRTASSAAVPDDAHSTVSTSSRVTRSISACGPAPHRSRCAAAPVGSCARSVCAGGVGGHHHRARPIAFDLQRHRRRAGAGGEADHLEPIGVRVDDGQRAVTDRAGRAEDREAHRSGSHQPSTVRCSAGTARRSGTRTAARRCDRGCRRGRGSGSTNP